MRLRTIGVLTVLALAVVPAQAEPVKDYLVTRIGWLAAQKAPGLRALGPIQMGPPTRDEESLDIPVLLEAGRCYSLVGTSAATVEDADMYLFSPEDDRLADDKSDGRDMFLITCAKVTGPYRVELKLKDGKGDMALRVFIHDAPGQPPRDVVAVAKTARPHKRLAGRSGSPAAKSGGGSSSSGQASPPRPREDGPRKKERLPPVPL